MVAPEVGSATLQCLFGGSPEEPPGLNFCFCIGQRKLELKPAKFPALGLSQLLLGLGVQGFQSHNHLKVTWTSMQLAPWPEPCVGLLCLEWSTSWKRGMLLRAQETEFQLHGN